MEEFVTNIKNEDSYLLKYYEYGEAFYGSFRGMRYRLSRDPMEAVWFKSMEEKQSGKLVACIWPEPFSFDKTDESLKVYAEFPFTEEGKESMVEWLNQKYKERQEEWESHIGKLI